MVNILLAGFKLLYNSSDLYDINDVKFVGIDSERFNNFLNHIRTYREICEKYISNFDISKYDLEKIDSLGIYKTVVRNNYMRVTFQDNENRKYYLMISKSGVISSNIENPLILVLYLLRPSIKKEVIIELDRKYSDIIPIEILFEERSYLQINDYTNYRKNVEEVKFGIEFEINSGEAWEDHIFKKILNYMMKKYSLIFEEDASVSFIEIKSEPMEYEDILKIVRQFEKLRNIFQEHFDSTFAGFHVHFSKMHTDSENRARQVRRFIAENISYDDYYNLFGRYPNDYSELKTKDENSRYQFINTNSYKTIEVRGGTTKMTCDLFKVLEFARDLAYIVNSNIDIEYSSKTLLKYFKKDMALA